MQQSPSIVGHVSDVLEFRWSRHRRGVALLSSIVCILILSAISISLVRTVLARLHEADLHQYQLQADSLAQSALERGRVQRTLNPA